MGIDKVRTQTLLASLILLRKYGWNMSMCSVCDLGESGLLWVHNSAAQSTHQHVVWLMGELKKVHMACCNQMHRWYKQRKTAVQTNILIGDDVWLRDKRSAVTWQLTMIALYTSWMATIKCGSNTYSCSYFCMKLPQFGYYRHLMTMVSCAYKVTIVKMIITFQKEPTSRVSCCCWRQLMATLLPETIQPAKKTLEHEQNEDKQSQLATGEVSSPLWVLCHQRF